MTNQVHPIFQDILRTIAPKGSVFADAPVLDCPPDPLRKAAESISLATKLTPSQIAFARSHDWFVMATDEGALIVLDRFSYNGKFYEEQIIWGGTFAELRNWAGY